MTKKGVINTLLGAFLATFIFYFPTFLSAGEILDKETATKVAENYLVLSSNDFSNWKDAEITHTYERYSSNDILIGYEFTIKSSKGRDAGFLLVNIDRRGALIPFFNDTGKSISEYMTEYYHESVEPFIKENYLDVSAIRMLSNGGFYHAIGIKFNNTSTALSNIPYQNGWYIFAQDAPMQNADYQIKGVEMRTLVDVVEKQEENELLDDILNLNHSSKFFELESSGEVSSVDNNENKAQRVGVVYGGFSDLYQENRNWGNGHCAAGCTPVAWTILLEYWDRNGYPKLIGSANDNRFRTTTDREIRNAISSLRSHMGTFCSKGEGATSLIKYNNGVYYAHSRGYSRAKSYTYYWYYQGRYNPWNKSVYEINSKRPVIAQVEAKAIDPRLGGYHAVVAYAYKDYNGTSRDRIKVKTGWSNLRDSWVARDGLEAITNFYM